LIPVLYAMFETRRMKQKRLKEEGLNEG
jgi:hypothetical protein